MAELATEDFNDVELMRVSGPVHAIGSPPEGDHWTEDHLRQMADAAKEFQGQLFPPNKIGHSAKQRLLYADGITPGERPAAGWLENIRLTEDGQRLLADVKKVPAKVAQLIRAGAWRTRSAELSKVTSQKTGQTWPWVITGLSWLGEKMPSIHSLEDVVRLYEDADGVELRCVVEVENAEAYSREAVDALRQMEFDGLRDELDGKTRGASDTRSTVAKITLTDEQQKTLAKSLGIEGDEISVEKLLEAAETAGETDAALTEEQQAELAKSLGIEGEVTPEKLLEAAKAKGTTPERQNEQDDLVRRLEAAEKDASDTKEELRLERRRHFVEDELIGSGKIEPGARKKWEGRFDKDEELALSFAEDLKPDETLLRELGSDEDGTGETSEEVRKLEDAQDAARLGLDVEELV